MKFLIINGPNLNLLGLREPDIYGKQDYKALCGYINENAVSLGIETEIFQSNHEGDLVDKIQGAYGTADGILINPAAYTHTSVAIRDALLATKIPAVEVHLSNVYSREDFRQTTYTTGVCIGQIAGFGGFGYQLALLALKNSLNS